MRDLINTIAYNEPVQKMRIVRQKLSTAQAAASSATACRSGINAAVAVNATVTTQPPYARCIIVTPAGTTGNVTAKQLTITGTDINDDVISETLAAFEAGAATARTSTKAFKTITNLSCLALGDAVTLNVGTTDKIGIPFKLGDAKDRPMVEATVNGTIEGTAPTLTADANDLAKNNIDLNSSLAGTEVCIYWYL